MIYKCCVQMGPYIRPYCLRAVLAVLCCILAGSMDAVIAWSLKPYTDLVMVEKSIKAAWYIPFVIVLFAVVQGTLNYFASYFNAWVGGRITNDLKFKLYKKLLTLETAYFDKTCSGDIIFKFNNDADTASNGLLAKLKMVISRIASTVSLIFVLIINSWKLAVIAIFILGLSFLPVAKIRKKMHEIIRKSITAGSKIITVYNESYSGNKTIASYNLSRFQESKLKQILVDLFNINIKMVQRTSWLSPTMHVIISVGVGLSIAYGSYLIVTNQITSGSFVSFIVALVALYNPVKNLGSSFKEFQVSMAAVDRVFDTLMIEPVVREAADAIELVGLKKEIVFDNVSFEYRVDTAILQNFSLCVKKGETIALVGNSGGGKTTIVSLLPRFYDVSSGSIKIDGIDIRMYSFSSLRDNISVVFQDNFLFSGTIRENIIIGKVEATKEEVDIALKMAYLDEFVDTLKDGIDTEVGERGILLSGGQKQRVAIARAFIKNAPIVILDEATSALDNRAEAIVQRALENLTADKTVFVIAHRLSTIKNADKIAVIDHGRLAEFDSHNELVKIEDGIYRKLYEMQFSKNTPEGSQHTG